MDNPNRFGFTTKLLLLILLFSCIGDCSAQQSRLSYESLPPLPDSIGVAGPFVGIHNETLIVAGGANFAEPDHPDLWELPKKFHRSVWMLPISEAQKEGVPGSGIETTDALDWRRCDLEIVEPIAYGACLGTPHGVICCGGENSRGLSQRCFLLKAIDKDGDQTVVLETLAELPLPCSAGGAGVIGDFIYVFAGEVLENGERKATRQVWRIKLSELVSNSAATWEPIVSWPSEGQPRMFAQVAVQHDGFGERLYVIGGRHFLPGTDKTGSNLIASLDGWAFDPSKFAPELFDSASGNYAGENPWKAIADSPVPLTAGSAVPIGPAHIMIPNYATLEIMKRTIRDGIAMKDFAHPGFPRKAYTYHTITDTWCELGEVPLNPVTTPAVMFENDVFLISGEVSPRVRTNLAWRISFVQDREPFGWVNMSIVALYLLGMLGIGVWFTFRNQSTDDYFRGGKNIPWWAAGCSIFATMLSSITYMAVPSKAFAQDWVYWLGSLMILAAAPIAIYLALPFFRRLDATSAYEYLEARFNRTLRWIGSGSFSLFHVFRMGVVLALAALALASITPLSPAQCVVVMGALSIIYCTLGGIEAVVWTDTIQTFVLIGGALLCFGFAFLGAEPGSLEAAVNSGKFHMVNLEFGSDSFTMMALWVVIIGGMGQNIASYTSDQAVVQRYMTTPDRRLAARSIWLNGFMAIPASAIFFAMGTAFWMFYQSHPDKLDPLMAADRIMPHFISQELPIGLAGLVVAGIFAAAQSTVSTSMNSGATAIVTDFFRPIGLAKSERQYLWLARVVTLLMGVLGTFAGLLFVDPAVKSLWDEFIGLLGMFLGVLAGLFALGATTKRASSNGSLIGAVVALVFMTLTVFAAKNKLLFGLDVRQMFDGSGLPVYRIHSYLYGFVGIAVCYGVGYVASLLFPSRTPPKEGLTLWDRPPEAKEPA